MADSFFQQVIGAMAASLATQQGHQVSRDDESGGWNLTAAPQTPGETTLDIVIRYREQDLHANDAPPRIVCVPRGGDITSPDRIGAQKNLVAGRSIVAIRTREFRFQVFCWGGDQAEAEQLLHGSILAFHSAQVPSGNGAFHNAINFSDEVWEDQQAGQGGQNTLGSQISYVCSLQIMVTTMPQRLTRPTKITSTLTMGTENEEIQEP